MRKLTEGLSGYEEAYRLPDQELNARLKDQQAFRIRQCKKQIDPLQELEVLYAKGIRITAPGLSEYPEKLAEIPDRPEVLYYRGNLPNADRPSVAIIGARRCSSYGSFVAQEFAGALAKENIQIISGLALGIDSVGQKEAFEQGGDTFGVLGCGVDICYPASNRALYRQLIASSGGVLSEFAPGTKAMAANFPQRNRIISALSDLVLVVEARIRSGTMITVSMALEQGREVMAIPGRITDPLQGGCLYLLQQGAGMALKPEDVLSALHLQCGGRVSVKAPHSKQSLHLTAEEQELWEVLDFTPQSPEELVHLLQAAHTGEPWELTKVMYHLVLLCGKGYVSQRGGRYQKLKEGLAT
ncbi:MAG: DNA-processing protein DprA [Lachnospiraceae bacterium]|nr:DNA-processing protein DprA [Lachnospiraceae bacterium]